VLDEYSENEDLQNTALSLVDFKLDILWTMLDSIEKKQLIINDNKVDSVHK
jgi:pyrroloquinoline quinone (PQQ) biosynthesis protein C